MGLSWQGDKRSNGERKEFPYELKFTMTTTTDGDTQNPHSITAYFLEELINTPSTTLAQFMQVRSTQNVYFYVRSLPRMCISMSYFTLEYRNSNME